MDPVLAQIYGTNSEASDLEKLASAQMAEELSSGSDYMTDDDVEMMAQQVLNDIEYGDDVDDETMSKVAEADKLGRVMAHSMWQELGHIKEAKKEEKGYSSGRKDADFMEEQRAAERAMKGGGPVKHRGFTGEGSARRSKDVRGLIQRAKDFGRNKASPHLQAHRGKYMGLAGLAAGALGKTLYDKSKESSALDTLAEARAIEILEANGIDPGSLTKQASYEDVLSSAVENRALEILAQYGIR